jgi:hypothetical protein
MYEPEELKFVVDEQYENEKGVFTVISIHKDQMVIRWEDGEEVRTDIDLQRRIVERRQWELHKLSSKAEAAGKRSRGASSSRKKTVFSGFALTDFKTSAAGTTWRSRSQLGEAVVQQVDTNRFKLNSWAFGKEPEMHVQDVKHHGQANAEYLAKFFVRVDEQSLFYGFRVVGPHGDGDVITDWEAFSKWLTDPENEDSLRTIAVQNDLTVCCIQGDVWRTLLASDKGWQPGEKGEQPIKEGLAAYIDSAKETAPCGLEVAAVVDKSEAVAYGLDIAANIGQLFTRLLPLYHSAVIH